VIPRSGLHPLGRHKAGGFLNASSTGGRFLPRQAVPFCFSRPGFFENLFVPSIQFSLPEEMWTQPEYCNGLASATPPLHLLEGSSREHLFVRVA